MPRNDRRLLILRSRQTYQIRSPQARRETRPQKAAAHRNEGVSGAASSCACVLADGAAFSDHVRIYNVQHLRNSIRHELGSLTAFGPLSDNWISKGPNRESLTELVSAANPKGPKTAGCLVEIACAPQSYPKASRRPRVLGLSCRRPISWSCSRRDNHGRTLLLQNHRLACWACNH